MGLIKTDDLVGKIKTLPPLDLVVQKLLAVVRNDNVSATEVTENLSSDQAIASKVLALVNSSFYGFPSKITTISRAVVILGNKSIQNLALSFAAMDAFKDYKGAIPVQKFWSHALAVATASQSIAKHIKHPVPEEMFIGGLLHDIGQLILSIFYPEHYNQMLDVPPEDFIVHEKNLLGVSHQTVGAMLLTHWQLPPVLTNIVNTHHLYDQYRDSQSAAIISVAEFISSFINRGSMETIDETAVSGSLEVLGINRDSFTQIVKDSYVKTVASEASFDIKSKIPSLLNADNTERTIVVLAKSLTRREMLASAIRFMGYSVHAFPPKKLSQAVKMTIDGVVFDPTSSSTPIINSVSKFIEPRSIPSVIVESGSDILLTSPTTFVQYPFPLSELNSLFEEEA